MIILCISLHYKIKRMELLEKQIEILKKLIELTDLQLEELNKK